MLRSYATIDMCKRCGQLHAEGECKMKAAGPSRGAKKGWSVRNKGHVSSAEKSANYSTSDNLRKNFKITTSSGLFTVFGQSDKSFNERIISIA
jgi:hypothetical protein